jgi:hypothetical protein
MKIMSVVDKRKISVAPCAHRTAKTPCLIAEAARRQRALRIIQQRSQNGVGDPFQDYAVVGRDPDQKAGNRGISQAEEFGSFGMSPPRQRYTCDAAVRLRLRLPYKALIIQPLNNANCPGL